jgi:hypothetical protein
MVSQVANCDACGAVIATVDVGAQLPQPVLLPTGDRKRACAEDTQDIVVMRYHLCRACAVQQFNALAREFVLRLKPEEYKATLAAAKLLVPETAETWHI